MQHGFTDYSDTPAVATAPETVGFTDEKAATTLCRVLAGNILLTSLFTRAEWGLVRALPYNAHLMADVAVGAFAVSAPWLFGFAENKRARTTCQVAGAFGLIVGLLSRPEEMPEPGATPAPSNE